MVPFVKISPMAAKAAIGEGDRRQAVEGLNPGKEKAMLWILNDVEQLSFSDVSRYLPTLSEARQLTVRHIHHEQTKLQSVLADLLLRYALRQEYGIAELPRIETGERGKPYFPDCPELCFNLSHCKTAVACALDSAPVGVDVQDYRPIKAFPLRGRCPSAHTGADEVVLHRTGTLSPAPQSLPLEGKVAAPEALTDEVVSRESKTPSVYRVLSGPERAWVEAGQTPLEQDRRFVRVWTCKEAYGKALGVGLDYAFRDTSFLPAAEPWTQDGFTFTHWDLPSAALTVCSAGAMELFVVSADQLISQIHGGR